MLRLFKIVLANQSKKNSFPFGCDELFALWNTSKVYTGSDGIAQFSIERVGFKGKIYIDGKPVFEGKVMASNNVYI